MRCKGPIIASLVTSACIGLGVLAGLALDEAPAAVPSASEVATTQRAAQLRDLVDGYKALTLRYDSDLAVRVLPAGLMATAPSHFAWMRSTVGTCQAHRVLGVRDGDLARFELQCERGVAEVAFAPDLDGRARRMLVGVRGLRPQAKAVAAARQLVGWRAGRNPAPSFVEAGEKKSFRRAFDAATADRHSCRVGAALLASHSGGVFALHCEGNDDARVVVDVNDDGQLRRALIVTAPIRG